METCINVENIEPETIIISDTSDKQSTINSQDQKHSIFPKKLSQAKKRKWEIRSITDERADETYAYLKAKKEKEEIAGKKQKDECEIFGELIVTKLRNVDNCTRQLLMTDINNIMCQAIIRSTCTSQFDPLTQTNTSFQRLQPSYSYSSQVSPIISNSSSITSSTQLSSVSISNSSLPLNESYTKSSQLSPVPISNSSLLSPIDSNIQSSQLPVIIIEPEETSQTNISE